MSNAFGSSMKRDVSAKSGKSTRESGDGETPTNSNSPEERVYRTLYEGILDHRLLPGTKLKEVPLAEAFSVTRGVIRKALVRLAAAKVVTIRSQYGASVASPSSEEVGQIFAARRLVELAVVENLTGGISAKDAKELRNLMKKESDAYGAGDMRAGIKLSADFHVRLAKYAGNAVLTEFLEQLVARTPLIYLAHGDPGQSVSCSEHEHADIVAAILAGDRKQAVQRMLAHLQHLESHVAPRPNDKSSELARMLGL
ncbi:GntR family transcriptional regulator [Variovorax sp. Sphag1AA]|uniref:GntR family transcriptional regulator n=1 Tax=Variovorax sp. Sphag1AA TaxID=2587027 RepID=UPI00160EABC4|nr:GntR family transcriptional regulator [Variovorax sp. Sphag1AA]MBB3182031.1 DNA-binding GntR family transcriptional regulator [Variovorax sp. Sphag1AA]